ncbi:hypothetical protein G9A89_001534 [Geosiphon pyriformis]|nr:hypothetical protein G9A89_001534 [Geosiphon pyriformis]
MEAATSGGSSSLKTPLGAFSGPAGGVSLVKSHSDGGMYSDMESDSGGNIVDDILVSSSDKSFLGSVTTTPKAKRVRNDLACGSPLGTPDYDMGDNDDDLLPPPLGISLERKWLDPKVIKTQVEVAVKKSFALDINLSAMEDKSATTKTQFIRKLFSKINGFGGATTPSKFEEIIRSTFTSEISMEKTASLAREEGITINTDLKKLGILHVAKAVEDRETWASRDQFRALLFTLPVGTTVHDLGNLLEEASGKTCVINWSLESRNRTRCAVVGFKSDEILESAFCTVPILGGVKLSWTRLGSVQYNRYEKLGHSVLECNAEIASIPKPLKLFIK